MKLQDYNFQLPEELIASFPLKERSKSKLLVLEKLISDRYFIDLPELLEPNDVLVINDTAVFKARFLGKKASGSRVEVLIERVINESLVIAQTKSNSKLKEGDKIFLSKHLHFLTLTKKRQRFSEFKFSLSVEEAIKLYGRVPLPPYIKREASELDLQRYQTIYADFQKCHSVAAPTAGLHFDQAVLDSLTKKGVKIAKVTLHVGMGTFKPIREPKIKDHHMHKEQIEISKVAADVINETKTTKGRIICVGTTSLRCIESVCKENNGKLKPFKGETNLFIYPGYKFKITDILITNFHLPFSSLLLLVSAFAGHDRIMLAYQHAVKEGYRFYSYGDSMIIYPERTIL